jgi:3-oxoacyl-[acyl-carrier protein] reductase
MEKVAVITGTRKGIGRFLVDHYLDQGFRVAGCSRGPMGEKIANYRHYELDVADESAAIRMLNDVAGTWGRVDVLLNNAGIASMNHVLLTPLKTVEQIFSTNVFGTVLFAREAAKHMSKRKSGRIVNFATVATPLQLEGEAAYAASKAAVKSYTEIMARELAPFGITVNAVGPTPVDTDLIRGVPKNKMDALIARQAIARLGTCEDIANVIDFLVADSSDFITGQTIYLGGVS